MIDKPMYQIIWDDATPLGKWTVAIPVMLLVYALIPVYLLMGVTFYLWRLWDKIPKGSCLRPKLPRFWNGYEP